MKHFLRFFLVFLVFFISNLVVNILFKHNWNVDTAFSVAFGTSLGIAIVYYYITKKLKKK
ncbi:hypothetical protein E2K98_29810 [Bacillus salipaludis]|uniref:Uncharacterized protein n=1 Tax=Bacillus salipaludis TaxID=2547811 RepID=A0A4V3ASV3_9BACI|nr:hypothetical protein E2K98_29810 [Bacillus salipaludis]